MAKYIVIFLCFFLSIKASAQQNDDSTKYIVSKNYWGFKQNRIALDSGFYLPRVDTSWTPFRTGAVVYKKSNNTPYYWNGSKWQSFSGGSSGITSITAGTYLTGGTITTTGTIGVGTELTALAAYSGTNSTGVIAKTAANTFASRTFSNTYPITVSNGSGVSGNPVYGLDTTYFHSKPYFDGIYQPIGGGSTPTWQQTLSVSGGRTLSVDNIIDADVNNLEFIGTDGAANWRFGKNFYGNVAMEMGSTGVLVQDGTVEIVANLGAYIYGGDLNVLDGNIGIGTNSPSHKLDVLGTGYFEDINHTNAFTINNSYDEVNVFRVDNANKYLLFDESNAGYRLGLGNPTPQGRVDIIGANNTSILLNDADNYLQESGSNGDDMQVFDFANHHFYRYVGDNSSFHQYSNKFQFMNGNVGIGVDPSYTLDVAGVIHSFGGIVSDNQIEVGNSLIGNNYLSIYNSPQATIQFKVSNPNDFPLITMGLEGSNRNLFVFDDENNKSWFDNAGSHDHKVGINTQTPSTNLDVVGTSKFTINGAGNDWSIYDQPLDTYVMNVDADLQTIQIGLEGSNYNVGIGTTSPTEKLDVKGNVGISNHIVSTGGTVEIEAGAGAGTGATVSIIGTDIAGEITINTGIEPSINSVVCAIGFTNAYTTAPYVVFSASNDNAALSESSGRGLYVGLNSEKFVLISNSKTPLEAETEYKFTYHVIQ